MSVIRRPGVLGRTTHRRVVGVTTALSATAADVAAVGTWFLLIVVHARTLSTALVGLAILLTGSIARVGVLDAATAGSRNGGRPGRLLTAIGLSACWIGWLLAAETVGGVGGALVGGGVLSGLLAVQYGLENRIVGAAAHATDVDVGTLVPSTLQAVGATSLLASVWFVDLTLLTMPLSIAGRSAVLEVGTVSFGVVAFALCTFLGHQRRVRRRLAA